MKIIQGIVAFFAILLRNLDPFRIMREEEMDNQFLLLELDQRICAIEKMMYEIRTCPVLNRDLLEDQKYLLETLQTQLDDLHSFRAKVARWK